jgi:hypothetical protein
MVQSQSHVLCVTELPQAHKLSPVHPDWGWQFWA